MKVVEFDLGVGRLVLSGGLGGWNMTRTTPGFPPTVEIIDVEDLLDAEELVEAAIRGDATAARALFYTPLAEAEPEGR